MTIYRGVGGVNREIKQQFRGVGGVNREIKEQYRGVGGVNRKVFSSEPAFPVLYENGKENISIAGGFIKNWNSYGAANLVVSKQTDGIHISYDTPYQNGNDGGVSTVNAVNTNAYTKLKVTLENVSGQFGIYINLSDGVQPYHWIQDSGDAYCNGSSYSSITIEVSLSNWSVRIGKITISVWASKIFTIKKIWLE